MQANSNENGPHQRFDALRAARGLVPVAVTRRLAKGRKSTNIRACREIDLGCAGENGMALERCSHSTTTTGNLSWLETGTTRRLSWVETLRAQISGRSRRIHAYEGAKLSLPIGSVTGTGKLHVGCQWKGHFHRQSQFVIFQGGTCNVQDEFYVFDSCFASIHGRLRLGSGYINCGAKLFVFRSVSIGNNVAIAENVTIRDSDNHSIDDRSAIDGEITIGDNVWIGMNVTILKGVEIGAGAAIAAGSLVNRSIPSGTLAAGVPARPIRPIRHS